MADLPCQQLGLLDPSQRIAFVRPNDKDSAATEPKKAEPAGTLSGQDARSFYESLLEEPSTSRPIKEEILDDDEVKVEPSQRSKKKKKRKRVQLADITEKDRNLFLNAVQAGDKQAVGGYLKKGMPVDAMDDYCWTPLMIAAAAGNEGMCRFLVTAGANYELANLKDQTVFDVLEEVKNEELSQRLIEFISENERASSSFIEITDDESFCDTCQKKFSGSETDHLTTTLHIYNAGKRGTTHSGFVIPESNIGYKMLKQNGWTEEQGLGPEGSGQKFPVRTILKQNRTGLGLEKSKPKVTHFRPHDERAIAHPRRENAPKHSWKKTAKRQADKEQRIAREFRSAFRYDDSVAEYLGL